MQRLQQKLAGHPFKIVAVNYGESATKVETFVKKLGLNFGVLLDPNQDAPRAWRVRVLPASFVIAPDGQARHRVIGEMDWSSQEAEEVVRALLPK